MSTDGKVVQTRLAPSEYDRLRELADREGRPLKEVVREAVRAYADAHTAPDPDDPLFTVEPPAGTGETVSAADADDHLYGDDAE